MYQNNKTITLMANDKEFTELLLNNLQNLTNKVDSMQRDMSDVRQNIAVLMAKQNEVGEVNVCVEKLTEKVNQIDKDVAIKSGLWGLGTSVVTLLIALLIAYLSGVFQKQTQYDERPFNTRGARPDTSIYKPKN